MRKKELNKYVALKKVAYIYNLLEADAKTKNDINALESYKVQQEVFLSQLDENSSQIYLNTYYFPFDLALYKYLENMKLSDKNIKEAITHFGIDSKLILDKIREYIMFSYLDLIESNYDSSFSELAKMIDNGLTKDANSQVNNSEIKQK